MYRKENEISINVAKLGREPDSTDFPNPTDLLIAKTVYRAHPKLVDTCSIRVILLQQKNSIEFNTMYLIS